MIRGIDDIVAGEFVKTSKFVPEREAGGSASFDGPTVALLPAGGELWEDFLDTLDVSLERFCAEGPGGWMLGYMDAFSTVGVRTVLIFFSGRVRAVARYWDAASGNMIVILPVSRSYVALRRGLPTDQDAQRGIRQGRRHVLARLAGAALSHLSTPALALARELRRHRCAAILCQEYEYFRFDVVMLLGNLLHIPVFATFQGGSWEANSLSRLWKARLVAGAAGLIIGSNVEAARVRQRYGGDVPISLIFNPVDVAEWGGGERNEVRAGLGAGPETRIVVWHGRIAIHNKGLDVMLAAWKRLRLERPRQDLRLMLMGTGEDAGIFGEMLAELPDCGISWRNEYVTDRREIRRFLAAGDVFAFPSRREGFAVAPIEAMACGLPVVAAAASGVEEALGGESEAGAVVRVGDVDAFAAALGRMIDDSAFRTRAGRQARARAEAAFSLRAVGEQLKAALFPDAAES